MKLFEWDWNNTTESWFLFDLLNENEIGLNYWKVWQIEGILIEFDKGRGDSFSSNNNYGYAEEIFIVTYAVPVQDRIP